nr:hypothetical protein [Tanacetum cinerariifolium]
MLGQVYVDDIISGFTKKSWCDKFEELMKNSVKTASTPIETHKPFVKDEEADDVDEEVDNFLARDLFHGNAKSKLLWLLLLQRKNMLLLLTAVDKFCGFRINY